LGKALFILALIGLFYASAVSVGYQLSSPHVNTNTLPFYASMAVSSSVTSNTGGYIVKLEIINQGTITIHFDEVTILYNGKNASAYPSDTPRAVFYPSVDPPKAIFYPYADWHTSCTGYILLPEGNEWTQNKTVEIMFQIPYAEHNYTTSVLL
jgi:hypothetical protein